MKLFIKRLLSLLCIFIPPIVTSIFRNAYLIIRNYPRRRVTANKYIKQHSRLIIFGNGPSLKESVDKYEDKFCNYDCMAVNAFANTEYYERLKPNMYLLADEVFIMDRELLDDRPRQVVEKTEKALFEKTKWDITLFLPELGRKSDFVKVVGENKNITILFYDSYHIIESDNIKVKYFLWNHHMAEFLAQTVLNTCLNLGIVLKYKEIYLLGADTSWIRNLNVDQDNNKVYTDDEHYYGRQRIYLYEDGTGTIPSKLHSELESIKRALEMYWVLKGFAQFNNVEVYNASEYSMIDAFERKKID